VAPWLQLFLLTNYGCCALSGRAAAHHGLQCCRILEGCKGPLTADALSVWLCTAWAVMAGLVPCVPQPQPHLRTSQTTVACTAHQSPLRLSNTPPHLNRTTQPHTAELSHTHRHRYAAVQHQVFQGQGCSA